MIKTKEGMKLGSDRWLIAWRGVVVERGECGRRKAEERRRGLELSEILVPIDNETISCLVELRIVIVVLTIVLIKHQCAKRAEAAERAEGM
jgi:hypothetical protein